MNLSTEIELCFVTLELFPLCEVIITTSRLSDNHHKVIKNISCSTQLCMKFALLMFMNVLMPTICWHFHI